MYILEAKRKDIPLKIRVCLIKMAISFIKQNTRKEEGMTIIYKNIKRITLSPLNKLLMYIDLWISCNRKGFPRTAIIALPYKKKRNQNELPQVEKEYNKIHSKRG